jgi:hypothetical protein
MALADPLELLKADEILHAVDGRGLEDLVAGEFAHGLGGLVALLLGLVDGDELVALVQDGGANVPTIIRRSVEGLANLE